MSKSKGSRYERELVNALHEAGYAALRLPSSGSATPHDLPDVLAMSPDQTIWDDDIEGYRRLTDVWAIELKMTSQTTAYAERDEIDSLLSFADSSGSRAFLGARFAQDRTIYLVEPMACRKTETKYGVPKVDAQARSTFTVDAATGSVRQP